MEAPGTGEVASAKPADAHFKYHSPGDGWYAFVVQTEDNVMIGGFIIVTQPTKVIIRAIGPSLTQIGVPDTLANPRLELHDASSMIGWNDDWQTTELWGIITSEQVGEIQNSQLAPTNPAESAIIATLPLTAFLFGTIPLVAPLTNMLTAPLVPQNDFLQGDFYGDSLQGSFVRKLLAQGFDVYFIDWGLPTRASQSLTRGNKA